MGVMVMGLAFDGEIDGFKRKKIGGIFLPSETAWVGIEQFAHQLWSEIGSFGLNQAGRCRNLWHGPCFIVLRNPHPEPFSPSQNAFHHEHIDPVSDPTESFEI
jgi:hypothetical protein